MPHISGYKMLQTPIPRKKGKSTNLATGTERSRKDQSDQQNSNDTRKQTKDINRPIDISLDERKTYQRNPNRHNNNSDSLLSAKIPSDPSRRPDDQLMGNSQSKSNGSGGSFRTKSSIQEDRTSWSGDFQPTVGRENSFENRGRLSVSNNINRAAHESILQHESNSSVVEGSLADWNGSTLPQDYYGPKGVSSGEGNRARQSDTQSQTPCPDVVTSTYANNQIPIESNCPRPNQFKSLLNGSNGSLLRNHSSNLTKTLNDSNLIVINQKPPKNEVQADRCEAHTSIGGNRSSRTGPAIYITPGNQINRNEAISNGSAHVAKRTKENPLIRKSTMSPILNNSETDKSLNCKKTKYLPNIDAPIPKKRKKENAIEDEDIEQHERSFSSRDQEVEKAKEKKESDIGEINKTSNNEISQRSCDLTETEEQSAEEKSENRKKETETRETNIKSTAIFQEGSDLTQTEEQSTKKKSMKNDKQSPEKPKKASWNRAKNTQFIDALAHDHSWEAILSEFSEFTDEQLRKKKKKVRDDVDLTKQSNKVMHKKRVRYSYNAVINLKEGEGDSDDDDYLGTALEPIEPPDAIPEFPSTSSCHWTFNEANMVLLGKFTVGSSDRICDEDKIFLLKMMERDDISVVTEGLLHGLDKDKWDLNNISKCVGERFHHKVISFTNEENSFRQCKYSSNKSKARSGKKEGSLPSYSDKKNNDEAKTSHQKKATCTVQSVDRRAEVQSLFKEQKIFYSMRVADYISYLKKWRDVVCGGGDDSKFVFKSFSGDEVTLDVVKTVLYLIDYDIIKLLPRLYDDFKRCFRLSGDFFPGGSQCMMSSVTPGARPFMGPNLYITPPAAFTHFHQDGHGTVDSGHVCLSGYNEVVMLRRLSEDRKDHALHILTQRQKGKKRKLKYDALLGLPHGSGNGERPPWPTSKAIELCKNLNYVPSIFILEPGQHLHINKGRIHAFRKMSICKLDASDCHFQVRSEIIEKKKLETDSLCMSIAWDWSFKGYSRLGMAEELETALKSAKIATKESKVTLAITETCLFHTAEQTVSDYEFKNDQFSGILPLDSSSEIETTSFPPPKIVLKAILPSLRRTIEYQGKALDDQEKFSLSAGVPDAWQNPDMYSLDPFGNSDFSCKLCYQELSNLYFHCQGCEQLLNKDFNICGSCFGKGKFKHNVQMNSTNARMQSFINHTADPSKSCKCESSAVLCSVCNKCAECECKCHSAFRPHFRFMSQSGANQLVERIEKAVRETASTKSIELSTGRIESRRPKSNKKRKRSKKRSVDEDSGNVDISHNSLSPEAYTLIDKISDDGNKPIIVTVPLPENVILDANRDSEGTPAGVENSDRKSLSSEDLVSAITESNTKRVTRRSTAARKKSQAKNSSKVMNRQGDDTRVVEPIIEDTTTSESTHRPKKGSTKVETRCSPRKKSKDGKSKAKKTIKTTVKKVVKKKVTAPRPQQQPTRISRRIQKQELSICPDFLCPHLTALNKYGTHLTKQFKGKEPNYTKEVEVRCKHCDLKIDEIDGKNIVDKLHEHILCCRSVQVLPRQLLEEYKREMVASGEDQDFLSDTIANQLKLK